MNKPIREIEGTWEEISLRGTEFRGQRVRLTLLDNPKELTAERAVLTRPEPTQQQAALGILPAAIGAGTFEDAMNLVRAQEVSNEDTDDLWETIAANRADRRETANGSLPPHYF